MKEWLCTQCGMKCNSSIEGQRVQTPLHGGVPKILIGEIETCTLRTHESEVVSTPKQRKLNHIERGLNA